MRGSSYLAKLEALRSLYAGIEIAVVDPEDEYRRLAETVGGAYVHLGAPGRAGQPLRPRPRTRCADPPGAVRPHPRSPCCSAEKPDPAVTAALDRGIVAAYESVGITADLRSHARPAPLAAGPGRRLEGDGDPAARTLAARLAPFTTGTHRGLFDGPTTTRPDGHLVVFSLRDLPDELKAAGTLLTLDAIWRRVSDPASRQRRLVIVDEAWLLMSRTVGCGVPLPHGQVGPQALGRAHRRHPGRR